MDRELLGELLGFLDRPLAEVRTSSPRLGRLLDGETARIRGLLNQPREREVDANGVPREPAGNSTLPLRSIPELRRIVADAETVELARVTGWSDKTLDDMLSSSEGTELERARVASKALAAQDRTQFTLSIALHQAFGRNAQAVAAINRKAGGRLDTGRLAGLTQQAFVQATSGVEGISELEARRAHRMVGRLRPHARSASFVDRDLAIGKTLISKGGDDGLEAWGRLVRRYKNLGIGDLMKPGAGKPPEASAAKEALRRLRLLAKVHASRSDNATFDESVADLDLSDEDAARIGHQLKSERRIAALGESVDIADALLSAGLDASRHVAAAGIRGLKAAGLADGEAERTLSRARRVLGTMASRVGAELDVVGSDFWNLPVGNLKKEASNLAELPGYSDLFGQQGQCRCDHCRSVLSPAAYFADLMCFVEEQVTSQAFQTIHSLQLSKRRPDLWSMPLSCEATNTQLPYLQIVNEVLERAIAGFADVTVDKVYQDLLPAAVNSLVQPYERWFDEATLALSHFGLSWANVAQTLGPVSDPRLQFGLAPAEWALISTPTNGEALSIQFGLPSPSGKLTDFAPSLLMARLDVSRDVLGQLFKTALVGPAAPELDVILESSTPGSVQPDLESVVNLTTSGLDLLHRFERLRRRTPWTVNELDRLLRQTAGGASPLSPESLSQLARLARLQQSLGSSLEEAQLISGLNAAASGDEDGLLKRLLHTSDGPALPNSNLKVAIRIPDGSSGNGPNRVLRSRLRATTGLTAEDFETLVGLARFEGATLTGFPASHENLSLLVRYAVVARRLSWSVTQLIAAVTLTPGVTTLASLTDLEAVIATGTWLAGADPEVLVRPFTTPWLAADKQLLKRLASALADAQYTETTVAAVSELAAAHPVAFGLGSELTPTLFRKAAWVAAQASNYDAKTIEAFIEDVGTLLSDATNQELSAALALLSGTSEEVAGWLIASVGGSAGRRFDPWELWIRASESKSAMSALGAEPRVLDDLASEDPAAIASGSQTLWSAMRTRYAEESDWAAVYEPYRDALLGRRRDALVAYLVHTHEQRFDSPNALYHYYLLDPLMDGCARTSRVVAGTGSLQLYVQRVRMNLERSSTGAPVSVSPELVTEDEWSWRRNYRVWEANRKVFLWPENWLDPGLRFNRTPAFETLERELKSGTVDEDSVRNAYAAYLREFERVSTLRHAGSFHEFGEDGTDVLHQFGVTRGDAGEYYYRRIENAHAGIIEDGVGTDWGVWRPVGIQIASRRVSPVVHNGRLKVFWVNYVTQPKTKFVAGESTFTGYIHSVDVSFSTLQANGSWEPARRVQLGEWGSILDPRLVPGAGVRLDPTRNHLVAREDYTLEGRRWDRVFALLDGDGGLALRIGMPQEPWTDRVATIDPVENRLATDESWSIGIGVPGRTVSGLTGPTRLVGELALDLPSTSDPFTTAYEWNDFSGWAGSSTVSALIEPLMTVLSDRMDVVDPVSGSVSDVVVDTGRDVLYLQRTAASGPGRYAVRRLNTAAGKDVGPKLSTEGLDELLSSSFQQQLKEDSSGYVVLGDSVVNLIGPDGLDFHGPMGIYFREIFLHIPRFVARALNRAGRYEEAQRWFHFLFDPTASESTDVEHPNDRVWRYREFRSANMESLLERLSDPKALAVHESDPMNPHAIASHRPTAYQKAVFMDYVDNLLDWGDALFSRDTRESVREATLLYVLAQDLLGTRPVELGACPEPGKKPRAVTFGDIGCSPDSPFLVALEETSMGTALAKTTLSPQPADDFRGLADQWMKDGRNATPKTTTADPFGRPATGSKGAQRWLSRVTDPLNPLFCVPRNDELDRSWGRVEDRLYKVRHCMNLSGVRRQLALFAPPIDPTLLIRARMAGLGPSEMDPLQNQTTPLRFAAMVQRAKELANLAQSLGGSLRNALERRDTEELAQVQQFHRANVLKLSTRQLERDLQVNQLAKASLQKSIGEATFRLEHFDGLISIGSTELELEQENRQTNASKLRLEAQQLDMLASFAHLVPQFGAFTAMTYGGRELGAHLSAWGTTFRMRASVEEALAMRSGIVARDQRRGQNWEFQRTQAELSLQRLEADLPAADIRITRAEQVIALHEREITHHEEVMSLLDGRFANANRLHYLADQLQALYRTAFKLALKAANAAQLAFRYERSDEANDDPSVDSDFIGTGSNYWAAAHRGMLAGEQLTLDLASMEQAYLETDVRDHELTQTFSLAQLNPVELLKLKGKDATAELDIPEWAFDLSYPGHYRRRLKSVRITIPCVAGNYTNVSATLTLAKSEVRVLALDTERTPVGEPPVSSIATSSGQADPGVFELSFRDARYLPFEGAGAISTWKLELPKRFRAFDYSSINDVLIHLSYTALYDGGLRTTVEGNLGDVESSLALILRSTPAYRLISLRQEFSQAYQRLKAGAGPVDFTLTDRHFPLPLQGKPLVAGSIKLLVERSAADAIAASDAEALLPPAGLALDGLAQSGEVTLGDLSGISVELPTNFSLKAEHTLSLPDMEGINDVLILIEYTLADGVA